MGWVLLRSGKKTHRYELSKRRIRRFLDTIKREWRIARSNRCARKMRGHWAWVNRYNPPRMCCLER